jgi:hypothetical protein
MLVAMVKVGSETLDQGLRPKSKGIFTYLGEEGQLDEKMPFPRN